MLKYDMEEGWDASQLTKNNKYITKNEGRDAHHSKERTSQQTELRRLIHRFLHIQPLLREDKPLVERTVQSEPCLNEHGVLVGARPLLPHAQSLLITTLSLSHSPNRVQLPLAQFLHVLLGLSVDVDVDVSVHRAVAHAHEILRQTVVVTLRERVLPNPLH